MRPETKTKLKKVREDTDKAIKEDAERDRKEEEEEAKAAAKKKEREERLAKLSPADQRKVVSLIILVNELLLITSFFRRNWRKSESATFGSSRARLCVNKAG